MQNWYFEIFKELLKRDVRFVVAGGIAVNLLGVPRFTADLDLIIALEKKNILEFTKCMMKMGYKPKVPVNVEMLADEQSRNAWVKEKNMVVFSFWRPNRPYEMVDIFIKEPIPFVKLWEDREKIQLGGIVLPVISLGHLIKLKKDANRLQDASDVGALNKLKKELEYEKK